MNQRAVIIVRYEEEGDLNTFLAQNGTNLEVEGVYEGLDAADQEMIEEVLSELHEGLEDN